MNSWFICPRTRDRVNTFFPHSEFVRKLLESSVDPFPCTCKRADGSRGSHYVHEIILYAGDSSGMPLPEEPATEPTRSNVPANVSQFADDR